MDDSETPVAQFVVSCTDLDAAIAFYTGPLGFRLDMIVPADAPRLAVVSGHGIAVRLESGEGRAVDGDEKFSISRASTGDAWVQGRAGMLYRDLIPGRLGGRFIASHIRIPDGGEVADYVHYHRVRFQVIYCRRGWVRVVYEDQGPPFVMREGDCVLQPPEIRHRVLEASPGMEVIEIGSPAEHETWRDHALELPTVPVQPLRDFGGQRFARHIAAEAGWQRSGDGRFEFRDCGIAQATAGLAAVRVLRAKLGAMSRIHTGEFLFFAVLDGRLRMLSKALGAHMLETDDTCVIPTGADFAIEAIAPCEVLEVALPAR